MSVPAAFQATFSDFRIVKGRKVAQIVLELPIELADAALTSLGGLPKPDAEAWVGVARLDPSRQEPASGETEKERRQFCDLPMAQQAGIKAADPAFARFLGCEPGDYCAAMIRACCGVKTRSDIVAGTPAGDRWR